MLRLIHRKFSCLPRLGTSTIHTGDITEATKHNYKIKYDEENLKLLKQKRPKFKTPDDLQPGSELIIKCRNPTAYNFYWRENYLKVIQEIIGVDLPNNSQQKRIEAISRLVKTWRSLSPAKKAPYYEAAAKENATCIGHIKGYNMFWKKNYSKLIKEFDFADGENRRRATILKIGELWRAMSPEEKAPYNAEAAAENQMIRKLQDQLTIKGSTNGIAGDVTSIEELKNKIKKTIKKSRGE